MVLKWKLGHLVRTDFLPLKVNSISSTPPLFDSDYYRPSDKSVYWKTIIFISHPKHMLWVLKRTILMRQLFLAPKTHI